MNTVNAVVNARIYTMDRDFSSYERGTIVFDQNAITAVGPSDTIAVPTGAQVTDGGDRIAVLPGLIDAHAHSSLLKGYTENAQLMDWLPEYQREHQVLDEQDVYHACLVTYLEALKGGTTTIADMYRKLHKAAEAATTLGIRAQLIPYAADDPAKSFFETMDDTRGLLEEHHGSNNGRIRVSVGLEHITYCSPGMYREARDLADAYGTTIHTHTSEQREEVEAVVARFGGRPVELFEEYGILCPGTVLAHGVWLSAAEIELLGQRGVGIAHCPTSNLKLAGGIAPLQAFAEAGVTVGLGSDGGISNNSLSLFETMKIASLLQKVTHHDATRVSARQALELATIRGAELLGIDAEVGSLEPGKQADLITVDLWQPHLLPLQSSEDTDPVLWNLVFAARASDVRDVWVGGERLLAAGRCTRLNESAALQAIHQQTAALLARRRATRGVPMIS